jgi:hypothetical protein
MLLCHVTNSLLYSGKIAARRGWTAVRACPGHGAHWLGVQQGRAGPETRASECSHSQSAAAVGARFWASQGHQQSRPVQE